MSNNLLILITIVCWGVGSFFYKLANDNIHPMMVSAVVTLLYLVLIPVGMIVFKISPSINWNGFMYAAIGGLGMCLGSLAYFFALQKGEVGLITASTAVYPALTLMLGAIFLREGITVTKIVGCLLALCSVYLLSLK